MNNTTAPPNAPCGTTRASPPTEHRVHLAARLPQLRCLLLDRPGTGLSDPHPLADPAAVRHEAETLVADVLDGLEIPPRTSSAPRTAATSRC